MQKKHIYLLLIVIVNLVVSIIGYNYIAKGVYSDEFVNSTTERFKNRSSEIITGTLDEIISIKNNIKKSNDKRYYDKFFSEFLDSRQNVSDVLLIGKNGLYVVKRDGDTYVSAIDSTNEIDVINWTRLKSGEVIGEWAESFSVDNNTNSLFEELKKGKHRIVLKLGANNIDNNKVEYITYATHWQIEDMNFFIVVRHREENLFDYLTNLKNIKDASLLISTQLGEVYSVPNSDTLTVGLLKENRSVIDSLTQHHYQRIINKEDSISVFNFEYKNTTYWSTYIKPKRQIGADYLILTIPNYAITNYWKTIDTVIFAIIGIVLLISLILIYLILFKKNKLVNINDKDFDINVLLENDESRFLEFKSSLRWDYRQEKPNPELEMVVVKTIAAFGNSDGGHLLIGVDDDKKILGLENDFKTLKKQDVDFYEIYLRNILHKNFGVKYITENLRIKFPTFNNKEICVVEVFKANEPAYVKTKDKNGNPIEKFYVRSGNSSHELKSLQDINEYIFDRFKK